MKKEDGVISSIKSIANNIVSNALWELIRSICIPVITIGLLAYANTPFVIVLALFILSLSGLVALVIKYRHVDFKYMFLEKTVYFEYGEAFSRYSTSHIVKALCNNVDRFYGRYTWDVCKVDMCCKSPQNSVIVPHPINDAYQKYDIYFGGRKFHTGDKFKVEIESTMHGDVQFPLFATTIIKPTNLLNIYIKLPLELLETNAIRLVTTPTPAEVGLPKTEDATLDENGEYIWPIKEPKLTYEYAIEWDFKPSKQKQFAAYR